MSKVKRSTKSATANSPPKAAALAFSSSLREYAKYNIKPPGGIRNETKAMPHQPQLIISKKLKVLKVKCGRGTLTGLTVGVFIHGSGAKHL